MKLREHLFLITMCSFTKHGYNRVNAFPSAHIPNIRISHIYYSLMVKIGEIDPRITPIPIYYIQRLSYSSGLYANTSVNVLFILINT